jgi:hypothetical protein
MKKIAYVCIKKDSTDSTEKLKKDKKRTIAKVPIIDAGDLGLNDISVNIEMIRK